MTRWRINLIGLFDNVVFTWEGEAKDKYHACRIAGAVFDGCYKRGEVVNIGEGVQNG